MESAIVDDDSELHLKVKRSDIDYSLWRSRPYRRRGNGFWRKLCRILVAEKEELLERHRISTKFDSCSLKHIWRNSKDERIKRQSCSPTAIFSSNEFILRRLALYLMRFSIGMRLCWLCV
jgi:hypothetical protein